MLPARRRLLLQQGRQRRLANEDYAKIPTKTKILKMLKACEAVERDVSIASSILEAVNDRTNYQIFNGWLWKSVLV